MKSWQNRGAIRFNPKSNTNNSYLYPLLNPLVNCSLIREKQKKKAEASQDQASRKRGVSEGKFYLSLSTFQFFNFNSLLVDLVSDSNPSPPKKSVTSFTLTHNKSTNNLTAPLLVKKDSSRGKQRGLSFALSSSPSSLTLFCFTSISSRRRYTLWSNVR